MSRRFTELTARALDANAYDLEIAIKNLNAGLTEARAAVFGVFD
jgi:hypothetical protein